MLHKTRGIVLNYIKYRDTSIIARIYTEEFGKQAYIINGIRSQKSKKSIGSFQPLTLLDLVVYNNKTKNIQRLSEHKIAYPFKSVPYDVRKNAIAMFLTEIMSKILEENHVDDSNQFEFIYHSIEVLDDLNEGYESFHIYILLKLAMYLGFGITEAYEVVDDGDKDVLTFLNSLNNSQGYQNIPTNRKIRNKALEDLLFYFRSHIENFGKINSIEIMNQVFE